MNIEGLRSPPSLRAAAAAVLLLMTALGTGALSPHGEHPWGHDGYQSTDVAVDARHAEDAAHFEASELAEKPGCVACVLQRVSVRLAEPRSAALPLPGAATLRPEGTGAMRDSAWRLPTPRGPPLS